MTEDIFAQIRTNLHTGKPLNEGLSAVDWQEALNRYSSFADQRDTDGYLSASEVQLHDFKTPRPSLHLMASNHDNEYGTWGSFWDQFGGGFCCLDSVLAGRMSSHLDTNYVPTAPEPQDCRTFFIHEGESSWSIFPPAAGSVDSYTDLSCRHGMDYQVLAATKNGLAASLEIMVHPELPLEVWRMKLTNRQNRARSFSWFAKLKVNIDSFPFYYFVPRVVCEGLVENDSLVFLNHDRGNKHPRQAFFTAFPRFDGYDMMSECFDGIGGRDAIPAAVRAGQCRNSPGLQPYAGLIAASQYNALLAPGETQTWTLVYGACPYDADERATFLRRVKEEVMTEPEAVAATIRTGWQQRIDHFKIKTPDADLDRYFNVWSRYQARNQARFIRALDKIGYRDILQDLLCVCDISPEYVRTMLLRTLTFQLPDGRAIRQYEKFSGAGHDLRMYMDSSSWIPDLLAHYLAETGDIAFLDVQVPYYDSAAGKPDPAQSGTVYEHALRAVESLASFTGFHGLCKIGYGDWNDALSGIGGENGVSVWLSCACVYAANRMAEVAAWHKHHDDADRMRQVAATMTRRINDHAWDGHWYIYAINGNGCPIGSSTNQEGKIHLNVNTWALFTGVAAAAGREAAVIEAITQLDTPCGHRLLIPAYRHTDRKEVGRIVDMKPGMFENSSIYTHGEAFFLYALVRTGQQDACYRRLLEILPSSQVQDITTGPRHQQSNFTVGPDHENFGMQLFSNFTGSLAWYRKVIEEMLGIYPDFDKLKIQPQPPAEWLEYECFRIWRNRRIRVICRRGSDEKTKITFDGQRYPDGIPWSSLAADTDNIIMVEYPERHQ